MRHFEMHPLGLTPQVSEVHPLGLSNKIKFVRNSEPITPALEEAGGRIFGCFSSPQPPPKGEIVRAFSLNFVINN